MNSLTKKIHVPAVYILDFAYSFRDLWANKPAYVFQVKPSVMVSPLLQDVSFIK